MADIDEGFSRLIEAAGRARPEVVVEARIAARIAAALGEPVAPPLAPRLPVRAGTFALAALVAGGGLWWGLTHRAASDVARSEAPVAVASPVARAPSLTPAPAPGVAPEPEQVAAPRAVAPVRLMLPRRARAAETTAAPPAVAAAEWTLLREAQQAVPRDPTTALRLVDEHARRYPNGALEQEREVIAIDALLRLGRGAAARARAERLLRRYPQTAHRAHVQAILAR